MEEEKHSIDTIRIENDGQNENFVSTILCILCHSLPLHPLQCRGSEVVLCKECYDEWAKPNQCPQNCEKPEYKSPSKITMKLFPEVRVACRYKENGCLQIVSFDSLGMHGQECGFCEVKCPFCLNGFLRKDLKEHEKLCEHEDYTCKVCKKVVNKKEQEGHSCFEHLADLVMNMKVQNKALQAEIAAVREESKAIKEAVSPKEKCADDEFKSTGLQTPGPSKVFDHLNPKSWEYLRKKRKMFSRSLL